PVADAEALAQLDPRQRDLLGFCVARVAHRRSCLSSRPRSARFEVRATSRTIWTAASSRTALTLPRTYTWGNTGGAGFDVSKISAVAWENRRLFRRHRRNEPDRRAAGTREDALAPAAAAGARRGQADRQAARCDAVAARLRQGPGADAVRRQAVQLAVDQPRRDRDRRGGAQAGAARYLREAPGDPGAAIGPDADRRDGRPVEHLRDRRAQVPHPVQHRAGRRVGQRARGRAVALLRQGPRSRPDDGGVRRR